MIKSMHLSPSMSSTTIDKIDGLLLLAGLATTSYLVRVKRWPSMSVLECELPSFMSPEFNFGYLCHDKVNVSSLMLQPI